MWNVVTSDLQNDFFGHLFQSSFNQPDIAFEIHFLSIIVDIMLFHLSVMQAANQHQGQSAGNALSTVTVSWSQSLLTFKENAL